jgi:hypothetical protein
MKSGFPSLKQLNNQKKNRKDQTIQFRFQQVHILWNKFK